MVDSLKGGEGYEKDGHKAFKGDDETREAQEQFISELTDLMLEQEKIKARIKDLKHDYKQNNMPVALVTKIFKQAQKNAKLSEDDKFELETITEWMESSKVINECIVKLEK